MARGRGALVLTPNKNKKNINIKSVTTQLQTKFKDLGNGFQGWVSKQSWESLPVEAAVATTNYALQGAAFGFFSGSVAKIEAAHKIFHVFGSTPLTAARNVAVMSGTNAGVSCVMKRIRGKDDVEAKMVAGFCSGFLSSVIGKSPLEDAIATGALFAVCHKVSKHVFSFFRPPVLEGTCYTRTRCMLSNLGLQNFEKNFKKHYFTDNLMPLLKESDLEMAGIPRGPRILILNHIERDPNVRKMRGS
ncbi:hypothetical protein MKX03_023542 [Papaver bracteatum]|nr:hypothetical protein MKX03_023542 [Papaver bracteatum]